LESNIDRNGLAFANANKGKFMKNVLGPILPHELRFGVKKVQKGKKALCKSQMCIKGTVVHPVKITNPNPVPRVSHLPSFLEREEMRDPGNEVEK